MNIYRGAVLRAQAEKYQCGEQRTGRVLADVKHHASSKEIKVIEYKNVITDNPKQIRAACVDYYRELFGKSTAVSKSEKENELLEIMPQLNKADL